MKFYLFKCAHTNNYHDVVIVSLTQMFGGANLNL